VAFLLQQRLKTNDQAILDMSVFNRSQHVLFATTAFFVIVFNTFCTSSCPPPFFADSPVSPHVQWAVELLGSVPRPGIYLFNHAPTVDEALRKGGTNPKKRGLVEGGNPRALQSGITVRVLSGQETIARITVSPMNPGTAFMAGRPLDVNRAVASELSLVPGISDGLAGRIIEFRETHGPFQTWKDLEHVRGLGPTTMARIRNYLQVNDHPHSG
jgi:competence protein ComEA